MANLSNGVQQYGTNYLSTPFVLTSSVFDVSGTTIFILDSGGSYKSWKQGRAVFLNNLPGTNKDQIPPYTAFQVLPGANITSDDTKLSFGTTIVSNSSGTGSSAFSSAFG